MEDGFRVEHMLRLNVNGRKLNRVVIDFHFKQRHPDITIEVIMALVKKLEHEDVLKHSENTSFEYFSHEPIIYDGNPYRIVFYLHKSENYLGVINAFRVRRKK